MDFRESDEQRAVRELARQIIAEHTRHEDLLAIEADSDCFARELWASLAKANLLGVALPESVGGTDFGLSELCGLLEEVGRGCAPIPAHATLVLAALPLREFGNETRHGPLLKRVVAGEAILTAALMELGGTDLRRPRTVATATADGWALDGVKICVPAAHLADRMLVSARVGPDEIGVFLVDPRGQGVELERQETVNREPQYSVKLSAAACAREDRLGDPDQGAAIISWIEARALLGVCAMQLGVSEEALRRTGEYTSSRKQFGRFIATFQGVALRVADAYIDVECMRSTLWRALFCLEQGIPADANVSTAKWWASRGGQRVAHAAQHLHGGLGADLEYPIHRFFLWSKQLDLSLGSAGPHLARIGELLARGELTVGDDCA